MILHHNQPQPKRYVLTTIKGISGPWRDEDLKQWQAGTQVVFPGILVRVADSPCRAELLDQRSFSSKPKGFSYPAIKPLHDMEAVKRFYEVQRQKHKARYSDVPEPLRTLLRERSRKDDRDMVQYKQAIQRIQTNVDPIVIKQLVGIMGHGPHQATAPEVLKDIFLPGSLLPDQPAFMKTRDRRLQALTILVDAIQDAKDANALTSVILVLLEASGIHEMKLEVGSQTLAFSRKDGTTSYESFAYSPEVSKACQAWLKSRIELGKN